MYVTKSGVTQKIQEDTYLYWASLGWAIDQNQDGIPDSTQGSGSGTVTKTAVIGTGVLATDLGGADAATTAAQLGRIVLPDASSASATPAVVVGQTLNVSTAGAVVSAPALPGTVGAGAALARYAIKNTSTGPITHTYPNSAGTTVTSTILPDEVKTYRQKSTSGWGTEAGSLPLTGLDGRYTAMTTPFENAPCVMFGHSFGASRSDLTPGPGADVDGHALERVAVRLRTKALNTSSSQVNIANYAAGGTRSDQILASIQTNSTPNTRGVVMLAGGHRNDQNFYGNSTPNTTTVAEVFRSIFAYLTCQLVQPYSSSSFAIQSGSWSSGIASASAEIDYAFNGDSCFITYQAVTGSGGTFQIQTLTGTVLATVTTGGFGVAFTGAKKVSGQGAGTHTLKLVVTSGTVGIVGALIPAATPPVIVWELEPPYNPAIVSGGATANTVSAQYQTATQAVLSDFDATRIVVVGYPSGWDPTVDTGPDGVHPSGQGHGKIANTAMTAIAAKITTYIQGLNWLTGSTADPTGYTPPTSTGPVDTTPPVISSFTATPGSGQNTLAWAGTDNIAITRWTVTRGGVTVYDGTGTSLTDTLLQASAYNYTLTAYDQAGNTATASATATPTAAATLVVRDTFTDAAGTLITAHTGETGATWVKSGSVASATVPVITAAGAVRGNATATAEYYASGVPGSANYTVEADFVFQSLLAASTTGIGLRSSTTSATGQGYLLRYVVATGLWRLDKILNNSTSIIGSFAATPAVGSKIHAKLTANDTTISAVIAGVTRISVPDPDVTAAGAAQFAFTGSTAPTDTTGIHLKNLQAA